MSEILDRCVVWPDSKTGDMSKPLGAEALRLLESVSRYLDSAFVVPSLFDCSNAMSKITYAAARRRVLAPACLTAEPTPSGAEPQPTLRTRASW